MPLSSMSSPFKIHVSNLCIADPSLQHQMLSQVYSHELPRQLLHEICSPNLEVFVSGHDIMRLHWQCQRGCIVQSVLPGLHLLEGCKLVSGSLLSIGSQLAEVGPGLIGFK